MAATLAGVGHSYSHGREAIHDAKKASVGTAVRAESLCTQQVDNCESGEQQGRDRHERAREGLPKFRLKERGNPRGGLSLLCPPEEYREEEQMDSRQEGHPSEHARLQWSRRD